MLFVSLCASNLDFPLFVGMKSYDLNPFGPIWTHLFRFSISAQEVSRPSTLVPKILSFLLLHIKFVFKKQQKSV